MVTNPDDKYEGVIGSALEYAAAVEFGRPDDMPNYPMQPYLRPAIYQTKAKRTRKVVETLVKAIAEAIP